VISLVRVDDANGYAYFMASPDNPTQRYLYRASLRTPGAPQRVTPAEQSGSHSYTVAPGARWAFHTFSRAGQASVTELVSLPEHRVIRALGKGATFATLRTPEFFRVTVPDGTALDGWMIKPKDFDASKRYPVLLHVYGEPAGQTVVDRAGGTQDLWHQLLADQGYVVMSVDPRGTPQPRGRAWRKVIYGSVGVLASRDIADAVRVMTRTRPFLDPSRVAVWGWSGGGSSTLNAMFRYPDVFNLGMSVAPVPDQRLYDTIYQERYMGTPQGNPSGYEQGSPITFAGGLRGKLLLVHGSGDDNVHYQGTERLVNKLVSLNKQFDLMVYPNRSHCICEGPGTTLHIYSTLTRYLLNNLAAGGK
jgi:dipeptidyl-peptidase 4